MRAGALDRPEPGLDEVLLRSEILSRALLGWRAIQRVAEMLVADQKFAIVSEEEKDVLISFQE